MAQILQPTEENLRLLRKFLSFKGLVGIPSETVYGLAANALDAEACQKIFVAKGRPSNDPLICHVPNFESISKICTPNGLAKKLADKFWPGPLTMILPKKSIVPDIVTSGLDSVAVRCPAHPVFKRLIEGCEFPLAAPSANPFSYISPTSAEHVQSGLGNKIEYILDGGSCEHGLESTIIDIRNPNAPRILRYGALATEALEKALDREIAKPPKDLKPNQAALAPGALPKHYSPKTCLKLRNTPITAKEAENASQNTAFLFLRKPSDTRSKTDNIFWLSEGGQLDQIAANLFSALRRLDESHFDLIIAEEAPELELGLAINDRLRRAASQ
ncbi:threonylcarbamoyl-AMP synthase [Puniceicoccaceae bacterium K14]|nr:threonylcarbamoyl-AMP synthase [Puniceicoccaceae bacterium K14]